MMRIDIISAVPRLLESPLRHSIVGRARDNDLIEIKIHDLRAFSEDKHNKVDDYPYGGGAGMVLTPQPVFSCVEKLKKQRDYDEVIFAAPDAAPYKQENANELSVMKNLLFLCGHYKGVDQRIRDRLITCEFSLGDFVLSGGEIPSLAIIDSIVRLLPRVLGDSESALNDSFQNGQLEGSIYTRPVDFQGMKVPDVLRSGDHKKIKQWRHKQSLKRTQKVRPDLYKNLNKVDRNKKNNG